MRGPFCFFLGHCIAPCEGEGFGPGVVHVGDHGALGGLAGVVHRPRCEERRQEPVEPAARTRRVEGGARVGDPPGGGGGPQR